MSWRFQADRPIYLQIEDQIKHYIVSGVYAAGAKLPTVRELAAEAAVNPNTLQKALAELEREGLVYAQRTSGRFVTEDEEMIKEIKAELALSQIAQFFEKMADIGYDRRETLALVQKATEEKSNDE